MSLSVTLTLIFIGLVSQLAKRAKLNRSVYTISLPRASERVEAGAACSVAGWGGIHTDCTSTPARLQEVDVLVMQDAACPRNTYGPYRYYNASTMMCVGDPKMGKDSWKVNVLLASSILDKSLLMRLLVLQSGLRAAVSDQAPLRCINEGENIGSFPRGRQRRVLGVGAGGLRPAGYWGSQ